MNLELHETVLNQLYFQKGGHMIHEGSLYTRPALTMTMNNEAVINFPNILN